MRGTFTTVVLIALLVAISSCMDLSNDNTNNNYPEKPEQGTPQFAEVDTDGNGVITDEEYAHWVLNR